MMGSAHTYDISAATLRKGQGIDVALDPSDLEMGSLDTAQMAARYEQTMKEQSSHLAKEDLSDMVAEHNARQKRKKQQDSSKSSKKYQFKF
jgi:splicing factor 3B subunit 2